MDRIRALLIAMLILGIILTIITTVSVYEYHELYSECNPLSSQYQSLQSLQNSYYALQQDYNTLQQDYENISNLVNAVMHGESGYANVTVDPGHSFGIGFAYVPFDCTLYGNIYISSSGGSVIVYIMDWINYISYRLDRDAGYNYSWSYVYEWEVSSISEPITLSNNEYANDYYVVVIYNNNAVPVTVYENFEPTHLVCSGG